MPSLDLGPVVGPQGEQGATGAQGIRGEQGLPGPNQVTNSTATPLTGVLTGNGSVVGVANIDAEPTADSEGFAKSGGTDKAIKARVPVYGMGKNLIRNWYFADPVNQRENSSYNGSNVYSISGWKTNPSAGSKVEVSIGAVTVSETGIGTGGMLQIVSKELLLSKIVTLSVLYKHKSGGAYNLGLRQGAANSIGTLVGNLTSLSGAVGTLNLSSVTVSIPSTISNNLFVAFYAPTAAGSVDVIAVKLELGTEQTLCHNEGTAEAPVWVLNDVPDYEYELYRCMTSTADSSDTYANKSLATQEQLAPTEWGTTASVRHEVGSYFCWNGLTYRTTVTINANDSITPGTNCELKSEGGMNSLSNQIIVRRQVLTTSITSGLNTLSVAATAIAGYNAIGVVGVQFASVDRTKISLAEFLIDNDALISVQFNSTYAKASGVSVAAYVMYAKE